jgi:hypothetical protein
MPPTSIQKTTRKLFRIYGIGIIAFAGIVGFLTLLMKFLARLT